MPAEGTYFSSQEPIVGELSGQADSLDGMRVGSTPSTAFKFWMGAARDAPEGCVVETTVIYDFDGDNRQGLTLVHFSAQLQPCLSQESTLHTLDNP